MEVMAAINNRRSIRKYNNTTVSHDDIERIIVAGMQAPSAKNRQPWRFVVVADGAKADMIKAMNKGLERETRCPKLPDSARYIVGARHTLTIMEQAPVTVFILNPLNKMSHFPTNMEERFYETANIQSVGACIQNMLLAAIDFGYGSLWNCDIFFAYDEISEWLDTNEQIIAAVSFGVSAEDPKARARNNFTAIVEWKTVEG